MSYEYDHLNIAFGNVGDISRFVSIVINSKDYSDLDGVIICRQWNGIHYATFNIKAPERWEFQIWDELIPQFPKLRFLMSRISDRDSYLNQFVRHRHEPYGFNCCLLDYTTPKATSDFPVNSNPISVIDDFLYEILEDAELCHAMDLLGYPKETLIECGIRDKLSRSNL